MQNAKYFFFNVLLIIQENNGCSKVLELYLTHINNLTETSLISIKKTLHGSYHLELCGKWFLKTNIFWDESKCTIKTYNKRKCVKCLTKSSIFGFTVLFHSQIQSLWLPISDIGGFQWGPLVPPPNTHIFGCHSCGGGGETYCHLVARDQGCC